MVVKPCIPTPVFRPAPSQSAPEQPPQPDDRFDQGSELGNLSKYGVGGLVGVGITLPAIYAGVVGGALLGSAFGAGLALDQVHIGVNPVCRAAASINRSSARVASARAMPR